MLKGALELMTFPSAACTTCVFTRAGAQQCGRLCALILFLAGSHWEMLYMGLMGVAERGRGLDKLVSAALTSFDWPPGLLA